MKNDATQGVLADIQYLLGRSIGVCSSETYIIKSDWPSVIRMARRHAVEPLVYDVALSLPEGQAPDAQTALYMKQVCLLNVREQAQWKRRIHTAVVALREAGIEPVLLKGFGLAMLYDKPYLRSWGDADIWVGVKAYHAACAVLREAFPEAIHHDEEYEELKHYCFVFDDGKAIELHRVAMDFPTPREERLWQTIEVPAMLGMEDGEGMMPPKRVLDDSVLTPSEPLNLLFVFLHAWEHFCGTGMPLKQVMDIALLVRADYAPLPAEQRRRMDAYLRTYLRQFRVLETWRLVGYVVYKVTGVVLPLLDGQQMEECTDGVYEAFYARVLQEGQGREVHFVLGGTNAISEREKAKQLPVLQRKWLTLKQRFAKASFLRAYAPRYARHLLAANIRKGLRRTLLGKAMVDY